MKRDIYAYAGKILRVDLTTGAVGLEPTARYAREWLGGVGIDQWLLYREVRPWVTPYEPANRLIFGAGPLVGTLAPGASRISAASKNAFTLGVGSSNCDSHFGPELKFAGYDHIILQGKAHRPVYLWIQDDHVELRDASHLWGKTTWETVDLVRQELGDKRVHLLSIGPAGENLVRGACIIQDKGRAFGRCGLGGIMGSKNLKAIAVRGTGGVEIASPERLVAAVDRLRACFQKSPKAATMRRVGTLGALASKQKVCGIAYQNFQYLVLPDELLARMNPDDIQRRYRVRNVSYMGCPIGCSRQYHVGIGEYAGLDCEGFQFEALADFAGKLAVQDPASVMKINSYCNQLGLDIDIVAGAIGWAMECFQRGILKPEDTDGLGLAWGDTGVILELTRKIAYREGFGGILAEGCARAAELVGRGSQYYAMHIKGQDLYEPLRGAIGWALGVCVSTRGGGHTTGAPVMETSSGGENEELVRKVYDGISTLNQPMTYDGKARLVMFTEMLHRVNNSLGICHFVTVWSDPSLLGFPEIAELYSAATGWETTEADLRRAATRILNVEKVFNILNTSLDRKDDYPTRRDLEEPIPTGAAAGWKLSREKWDRLLDEYYEIHNWDRCSGIPTRKCLEELNLSELADELERKIGPN